MARKSNAWTRLKKTRGQVVEHPTALTAPSDTTGMEGSVKPMRSLYAFSIELAVITSSAPIENSTLSVVAP